ncbi:drug resistance transporter, Bcr/CflA subfamily [Desulfocapsa sulfexigens DSM 10523]|uniref:Drug resistance transporter, Bcr/CflA subfamily n=1 Tax=Desulfocapsa sulfexigens (strain DSM 10523 / SB164P1) TaxID=1167006 RepID=M1PC09_DESSD|nr:multidrug effflux MFS transporter [Desulfocapsa sulfexigens]AGF77295.1 drug resistance transporter, Bcr/CflA subfamily [Desulfocapsa sulfexigens DSM 10523]
MKRFILLLALLTAFPPLATDMYLAATPHLQKIWQQPLSIINLTLTLFFVTYCISLLFYGPLSDRLGRKPPLIAGLLLFVAASFLCALAQNIWMLVAARIVQAMGAGAASAISLAMARDRLEIGTREKVLSQISVIMALAPMVAPLTGSLIMKYLSWPWIFVSQGGMGMVALAGVLLTPETHTAQEGTSVAALLRSYGRVLSNYRLVGLVFCNAVTSLPLFSFIAASSSIYINRFQMEESLFGLFFGANALCFMSGSMICMRFGKKIGTFRMITAGYGGIGVGGLWMLATPANGCWQLALPMGLITLSLGLSRPPSNNLVLEQVTTDAGTASATMVFSYFIFGAMAMAIASLGWEDKIAFIGWLACGSGLVSFSLWIFLRKYLHIPAA